MPDTTSGAGEYERTPQYGVPSSPGVTAQRVFNREKPQPPAKEEPADAPANPR